MAGLFHSLKGLPDIFYSVKYRLFFALLDSHSKCNNSAKPLRQRS